jgi:hypothetical protein
LGLASHSWLNYIQIIIFVFWPSFQGSTSSIERFFSFQGSDASNQGFFFHSLDLNLFVLRLIKSWGGWIGPGTRWL